MSGGSSNCAKPLGSFIFEVDSAGPVRCDKDTADQSVSAGKQRTEKRTKA